MLDREPADLTVFNGTNPNGFWSLYITDDFQGSDGGSLATGWTLSLTIPALFTVTKTADSNDGICNGDCSLREAIAAATAATGNDDRSGSLRCLTRHKPSRWAAARSSSAKA